MILDRICYSRGINEDYHWIQKPDYLDRNIISQLQPLFGIAENTENREYLRDRGKRNLYILTQSDYLLLCYIYMTEQRDSYGRFIYALEGCSCQGYADDFDQMTDILSILIRDLLNPANHGGIRYLFTRHQKLINDVKYNDDPLSGQELCEIDRCIHLFGYGNVVPRIRRDAEITGSLDRIVAGTEPEKFYRLDPLHYYNICEDLPLTEDTGGELYRVPDSPDTCELRFYLEDRTGEDPGRVTLSWILTSNHIVWGAARDYSPFSGKRRSVRSGPCCPGADLVYQAYYQCRAAMFQCAMEFPDDKVESRRLSFRDSFFSMNHSTGQEAGFETIQEFVIDHIRSKANPDLKITETAQRAVIDWYRVTCRISDYYDHLGKDTLFILNLSEGLLIFQFLLTDRHSEIVYGLRVGPEEKRKAFRNLRKIMNLSESMSWILKHTELQEFHRLFTLFEEQSHQSPVFSAVISDVLPAGCRSGSSIRYFCPEIRRCRLPFEKLAPAESLDTDTWKIPPEVTHHLHLLPPQREMLSRSSCWQLHGRQMIDDPKVTRRYKDAAAYFCTVSDEDLKSVDSEGTFTFGRFDDEIRRLDRRNQYSRLFGLCPRCGREKLRIVPVKDNSGSSVQYRDAHYIYIQCPGKRCRYRMKVLELE